ncbi:MAG: hypothetical protein QM778_38545 [Myxococcales bacterium]
MSQNRRETWCTWMELAASVAWFGMDYCWFEGVTWLAICLAVPTALCSLAVVVLTTPTHASRLVSGAMAAWAVMNTLWMLGDQDVFHAPTLVRVCFFLGLGLLGTASLRGGRLGVLVRELVAGFGRLRAPW